MKIPTNNQWTQLNNGDILGSLHETHNINFDSLGELKLSKRAMALIDSDTTGFGEVMSIVYFDGAYHIVTDDKVFLGDLSSPNFAQSSGGPTLGSVSDGIVCYSRLYVSDTTALAYLNDTGTWTTGVGTISALYPHPLAVFDSLSTYKLAVGNGSEIITYDVSGNAGASLTLPENYVATSLAYKSGYLYIGTKEVNGGEAAIFMWNGATESSQYKVDVGASWIYTVFPYRGSIAFVTNEGELGMLNGTSVVQLATFPVFHRAGVRWEQGGSTRGKVYNRGAVVIGDTIYINASGRVEVGDCPEMKSGIWCYTPQTGLYHYASPTTDLLTRDSGITASDSVITTSATHNLKLGDAIQFTTVSGLVGVSTGVVYYAIPVADATLKVAGSLDQAFAGNNITITGTATSDALQYAPNSDFGHVYRADSGAIALTSYLDSPDPIFQSDIIWGSEVFNQSQATKDVLCILTPRYNEGSFSTQKIFTPNVTETWQKLHTFFSGIMGSNESIQLKYRVQERTSLPSQPVVSTWLSATQFTTADPSVLNVVDAGDLIFIVEGYGQGHYGTITEVSHSAATVTVTIAESLGSATTTSDVRFFDFKKIFDISGTRENPSYSSHGLDSKNNWIQIMCIVKGFESKVQSFDLVSSGDKRAM